MNNRIREFADEAAKYAAISALPTGKGGDELFLEKFAELIIEECAQQAEIWDSDPLSGNSISCEIKLHFGIEDKAEEFENWCKESDDGGDDGKNT